MVATSQIRTNDLRRTTAMPLRESGAEIGADLCKYRNAYDIQIGTTANIYTHELELISRESMTDLNP